MIEALMSGTPVICSDRGACPEIITSEVGFVCRSEDQYIAALDQISRIDPRTCRNKALRDYHYHVMATNYVREYEIECDRIGSERVHAAAK
jgi:glycosyltransferase involved in cell wall biosynthesis